jgi:hypothetical protein
MFEGNLFSPELSPIPTLSNFLGISPSAVIHRPSTVFHGPFLQPVSDTLESTKNAIQIQ